MEGLFFFLSFGAGFVQLGLLLFIILAVVGARAEEDPAGERPAAIYYNGVLFLTVFVVLFTAFAIVSSLLNLTIDRPADDFFSSSGNHDGDWNAAVRALLAGLVAFGVHRAHDQRRRQRAWSTPGARIRRTFLYTVGFLAIIVATVAAVMALWSLWEIIAPGVTGAGPRSEGWVAFISAAFLAASASALGWMHLREAEPDAPLSARGGPVSVPPEPPPPPPRPVDLEAAPTRPARKRAPAKKAAATKKTR